MLQSEQVNSDFREFKRSQDMEVPVSCVEQFQAISRQELEDFLALSISDGISFSASPHLSLQFKTMNCMAPNNLSFMARLAKMEDNGLFLEML